MSSTEMKEKLFDAKAWLRKEFPNSILQLEKESNPAFTSLMDDYVKIATVAFEAGRAAAPAEATKDNPCQDEATENADVSQGHLGAPVGIVTAAASDSHIALAHSAFLNHPLAAPAEAEKRRVPDYEWASKWLYAHNSNDYYAKELSEEVSTIVAAAAAPASQTGLSERDQLKAQRDELLAAAKQMENALECSVDAEDWRENVMGPARTILRAAIQEAERSGR